MTASSWILLGGFFLQIILAATYFERRMSGMVTREEYQKASIENREHINEKLDEVMREIKASREARHAMLNTVNTLALTVEVLADRAGMRRGERR